MQSSLSRLLPRVRPRSRREFLRRMFWSAGGLGTTGLLSACGDSSGATANGIGGAPAFAP